MSLNIDKKRKTFIYAMILLVAISATLFFIKLGYEALRSGSRDDIFGARLIGIFSFIYAMPYGISLAAMFLGGLGLFDQKSSSRTKAIQIVSIVLSVLVVASFWIYETYNAFNGSLVSMYVFESFLVAAYVVSCASIALCLINIIRKKNIIIYKNKEGGLR